MEPEIGMSSVRRFHQTLMPLLRERERERAREREREREREQNGGIHRKERCIKRDRKREWYGDRGMRGAVWR